MINQGKNVPDNTIAFFSYPNEIPATDVLKKPIAKREWFDKWFYNCLPLTIGNQYGFMITAKQSFNVLWNGGNNQDDTQISFIGVPENDVGYDVGSHFGHGIITVGVPFVLKTPPGINLMTINPPNYILNNVTVMTGVVESDNIRLPFTFNLKIQNPNVVTHFAAGDPIAAFIPIPRYFADSFELVSGKDLFDEETYNEELEAMKAHGQKRKKTHNENKDSKRVEKDYFYGKDVYGNNFPDHQSPSGKKTIFE